MPKPESPQRRDLLHGTLDRLARQTLVLGAAHGQAIERGSIGRFRTPVAD